jgi:hypothetical protein
LIVRKLDAVYIGVNFEFEIDTFPVVPLAHDGRTVRNKFLLLLLERIFLQSQQIIWPLRDVLLAVEHFVENLSLLDNQLGLPFLFTHPEIVQGVVRVYGFDNFFVTQLYRAKLGFLKK